MVRSRSCGLLLGALSVMTAARSVVQNPSCFAMPTSMTPASWQGVAPRAPTGVPRGPLRVVQDIALNGPANRFDYQSIDPVAGRLYVNHMNAGRLIVVDTRASKVVGEVPDLPRATGVWAVPSEHKVFVSAA